jgi:hypothetical protein
MERALYRLLQIDQLEYDRILALLREKLPGKSFKRAWLKGQQMKLDTAIEASLAIAGE